MGVSDRYYNLHNKEDGYTELRFLAGDGLQSRELNELQALYADHVEGIAGALFSDGDRIEGADISVDIGAGTVSMTEGRIFLQGRVRELDAATLTIPMDEVVAVGLRYTSEIVTYLEDASLRDPSVGTRNANEPGAQRVRETVVWGYEGESVSDGDADNFHAVYTVNNGVIENIDQPPSFDGVIQAVARYDREANGSYIALGLSMAYMYRQRDDGTTFTAADVALDPATYMADANVGYVFSMEDGVGNVNGYKVEKTQATRFLWEHDPDVREVTGEPHTFADGGSGSLTITLNRAPISEVTDILVTKEVTEVVTHGAFTGSSDTLANTSVVSIQSVTQGGTTYTEGTDFVRSGDELDWSPGGAEPAPGSTYDVVYRYIDQITPDEATDETITVSGAVTGTTVFVDYSWKMPRVDLLIMDVDGVLTRVRGVSRTDNPQPPSAPPEALVIAEVEFTWYVAHDPVVTPTGVRAIPVSDLYDMAESIDLLFDLVASERLRNDANSADPSAKRGVFVDPLTDDDLRDAGIPQTAAVMSGTLLLSVDASVHEPYLDSLDLDDQDSRLPDEPLMLGYTEAFLIRQQKSTGTLRVNPSSTFASLSPKTWLRPAVDNWTKAERTSQEAEALLHDSVELVNKKRAKNTTSYIPKKKNILSAKYMTDAQLARRRAVDQNGELVTTTRARTVKFVIFDWGPLEEITSITMGGMDLTPGVLPQADANGKVTASFVIPEGLPVGHHAVSFEGGFGTTVEAVFTANGWLTNRVFRKDPTWAVTNTAVRTPTIKTRNLGGGGDLPHGRELDPLAQTFTMELDRTITSVDLWFQQVGDPTRAVTLQIRGTTAGVPNADIYAEAVVDMSTVSTTGPTTFPLVPVALEGGREYAIVLMTRDPDHELRIAQMGKYDQSAGWVTAQPYSIGVLLTSSNGSTWSVHQKRDLKFRINAALFDPTTRTVAAGQVTLTNASDILFLADVARPHADCDAVFRLTAADGSVYEVMEGAPANLGVRLDGVFDVEVTLSGNAYHSPAVSPNIQVVAGDLRTSGDYVSRAFLADETFDGVVILDALVPNGSTLTVSMEDGSPDSWQELTLISSDPIGDGFEERRYEADGMSGVGTDLYTRLKLELTGSEAARPMVQNLKAFAK
jgi:hypothetical protein